MELNISEYDYDPNFLDEDVAIPNLNSFKQLSRAPPVAVPPRRQAPVPPSAPAPVSEKKLTYDDILSSMSMQLVNGKLQLTKKQEPVIQPPQQRGQPMQQQRGPQRGQPMQQQQRGLQRPTRPAQQQQVQEEEESQEPRPPFTKEMHKKLMIIQHIKQQKEIQRIRQIKSTKLMFPNPNVNIASSSTQTANMNRFFKFVHN